VALSFAFHEIVNKEKWQDVQNHLSDVFKISLRTVDVVARPLTAPSVWGGSCDYLPRESLSADLNRKNCILDLLALAPSRWREGCLCPAGFHNFAIPLTIKNEIIAYLVVGPVIIGKRQDHFFYEKVSRDLNISVESLSEMVKCMKTFTFYGIGSIIDFLYNIGLYIFQFGYQNARLKQDNADMALMFDRVHQLYRERVLSALLDVSCSFVDAERGSIMLYDNKNKELYIKIAKGIEREIIDQARLKAGQGLSGWVFSRNRPLLVDNQPEDENIRGRLINKKIKNSILLPLKANNDMIGVLSLGTYKDNSAKFKPNSVETLDRLAALVEATLSGFPA
jgi:ligand-binding sensor protein/putative methionine-R-sulfoxide reductase with GAF domain